MLSRMLIAVVCLLSSELFAQVSIAEGPEKDSADVAAERLNVMTERAKAIVITSNTTDIPSSLESEPLFRYDDPTRGYVDGLIWRLGKRGRPLAIITNELHPNYLQSGPRIVFDLLSMTPTPFTAKSSDFIWQPGGSAVKMVRLDGAPTPASSVATRLSQIKSQARRFSATQNVSEIATTFSHLRLLPKEIDRYQPTDAELSDAAAFLMVNGRNPGLILFVETDGKEWSYGVGRLSYPSTLTVMLDDEVVWTKPPGSEPDSSYNAFNSSSRFP